MRNRHGDLLSIVIDGALESKGIWPRTVAKSVKGEECMVSDGRKAASFRLPPVYPLKPASTVPMLNEQL